MSLQLDLAGLLEDIGAIEDIVNSYNALIDDIGFDSRITVGLNLDADNGEYVVAALWPKGTMDTRVPAVRASGKTFQETLQCLKDGWEEGKSVYRLQRVRTMAMLIINITANNGSCSYNDLVETGQFSDQELKEYTKDAINDANGLLSKGPFSLSD